MDLELEYETPEGRVRALDGATLTVRRGEITAVVGESGSGKTTLGMAAGRILPGNAERVGGDLQLAGHSVLDCDENTLRSLRRDTLGFIFQNPVAALDPTIRVERQMRLAAGDREDPEFVREALQQVGMRDIPRVLKSYPHELSGGMAQRVGIAMALQRRPQLLIADEPTAAVDATLRPQILELLVTRCREDDSALLLLTHDLHLVAKYCSRIAVMYGGRVVEDGETAAVLLEPKHPYTRALLASVPGEEDPGERVEGIAGVPPVLRGQHAGCAFGPRCPAAMAHCDDERPMYQVRDDRAVCCHLYGGTPSARPLVPSSQHHPAPVDVPPLAPNGRRQARSAIDRGESGPDVRNYTGGRDIGR